MVTIPESASWPRRILALFVDWFVSTLAVIAIVGLDEYGEPGSDAQFYVLVVYVVESALFTWLLGGSFGKLVTRLRVVPADGRLRPLNPLKALLRQVMVALVIPPLIYRPDGRGLHDLVAGTVTVTLDTFHELSPGPRRPER
ncbi:RDD family protein [Nocardioides sp. cx-169]|uniref:RDD family protein n=1 Tax=Nocardioides sp. cx-169 TaxID=2899080 RepID=UPI001E40C446|nr:RDD family protein [Nocardioides sp. cx-169]MCD4535554.1 RDD family protein [Nocardioides sp. cx-169]